MEKDEFLLKRIRELAKLSYQRDIVTFSDFLNLNEQNMVHSQKLQELGVIVAMRMLSVRWLLFTLMLLCFSGNIR